MPLIYFVRHGQTDWNAARRLQGERDIPINGVGRVQAKRNGGVLSELLDAPRDFDFVSSPLLRTRETMEIIRDILDLPQCDYRTDDRLQEIRFGAWSGFTMEEIAERDPQTFARRQADPWNVGAPGGECYRELNERLLDWLRTITRPTVAVAHGGISRCLRGHILKLPPHETVHLDVPQDKVLKIDMDVLTWI